jgi:hypothetical protein
VQRIGGSAAFRRSDYNLSGAVEAWKLGIEFQALEGLRFRATSLERFGLDAHLERLARVIRSAGHPDDTGS